MKNLIINTLILFLVAGVIIAGQVVFFEKTKRPVVSYNRLTKPTATSTIVGPERIVNNFIDTKFEGQGVCTIIKDLDGIGYTYFWVNNGKIFSNSTGCH